MSDYKPLDKSTLEELQELLKRCPAGTFEALLLYRENGDLEALSTFLMGCIKRHTDDEYHDCFEGNRDQISFVDDLGIDSMTMMEIVMMVEECLEIRVDNQDLMNVRTYGDLNAYIKKIV